MALPILGLLSGNSGRTPGQSEFSVVADTKQLRELAKKVEGLGSGNPHIKSGLDEIGTRWVARIRANFRASTDPYGGVWEPIKHRKGQPLIDTSALLQSITAETKGLSIHIGSHLHYADKHNSGKYVIKRQFLPDAQRNLPQQWQQEYVRILTRQVTKALE